MKKRVLLTGISGFVGQHCAIALLEHGYIVRGSIRNLSKKDKIRESISKKINPTNNLEFCELNLLEDQGWGEAMKDVSYVLHVASPFLMAEPKDENEMIKPAVDGTLRALKAAKKAGVKKVVITSSLVSMVGDKKNAKLNQESWTNPTSDKVGAYIKSKTYAEKAAWDFYNSQKDNEEKLEITTIHPGPIFGPTLTGNLSGVSMGMIRDILTGKLSMIPNVKYAMSDVRDVANIHVLALENSASNGKRFIVTSEQPHSFMNIAQILHNNNYIEKLPKKAPSFLVKVLSYVNRDMKGMLPYIDAEISADINPTKYTFNWVPIPFEETITESAKTVKAHI